MDSCFDLVVSRQHGVASYEVISWSTDHSYPEIQRAMTSDETQIQIFANWPHLSHAKRVTMDNSKNPEYHAVATIRKLWTDKNCPAELCFMTG